MQYYILETPGQSFEGKYGRGTLEHANRVLRTEREFSLASFRVRAGTGEQTTYNLMHQIWMRVPGVKLYLRKFDETGGRLETEVTTFPPYESAFPYQSLWLVLPDDTQVQLVYRDFIELNRTHRPLR